MNLIGSGLLTERRLLKDGWPPKQGPTHGSIYLLMFHFSHAPYVTLETSEVQSDQAMGEYLGKEEHESSENLK